MAIYSDYPEQSAAAGLVALRPPAQRRISWGAVFAGVVMVVAVHILLTMLGAGIGLSLVDPGRGDNPSVAGIGIGGAVWWTAAGNGCSGASR